MKGFLFLLFIGLSGYLVAQNKVQWSGAWDAEKQQLKLDATIQEGWHLYSQHIKNDVGPVPTQFTFELDKGVQLSGEVVEPKPIEEYDPNFEANLTYFKEKVQFQQKLKNVVPTTVNVTVTYMVCNDVMCLPPVDEILSIKIN